MYQEVRALHKNVLVIANQVIKNNTHMLVFGQLLASVAMLRHIQNLDHAQLRVRVIVQKHAVDQIRIQTFTQFQIKVSFIKKYRSFNVNQTFYLLKSKYVILESEKPPMETTSFDILGLRSLASIQIISIAGHDSHALMIVTPNTKQHLHSTLRLVMTTYIFMKTEILNLQ